MFLFDTSLCGNRRKVSWVEEKMFPRHLARMMNSQEQLPRKPQGEVSMLPVSEITSWTWETLLQHLLTKASVFWCQKVLTTFIFSLTKCWNSQSIVPLQFPSPSPECSWQVTASPLALVSGVTQQIQTCFDSLSTRPADHSIEAMLADT